MGRPGTFVKGQSGNPRGRPKSYDQIKELAQKHAPSALRTLAKLSKKAINETTRVSAASAVLDRAYGRPPQAHTGEGGTGPILACLEVSFVKSDDEDNGKG